MVPCQGPAESCLNTRSVIDGLMDLENMSHNSDNLRLITCANVYVTRCLVMY